MPSDQIDISRIAAGSASMPSEAPSPKEVQEAVERLSAEFGDIVENGWASHDNPTRVGFFVREGRRPRGQMNPGRFWEITDGKGKFWELIPFGDHKITVTPASSALSASQARVAELEGALNDICEKVRECEAWDAENCAALDDGVNDADRLTFSTRRYWSDRAERSGRLSTWVCNRALTQSHGDGQ